MVEQAVVRLVGPDVLDHIVDRGAISHPPCAPGRETLSAILAAERGIWTAVGYAQYETAISGALLDVHSGR